MRDERRSYDSGWTLATAFTVYIAATLPLQRSVWDALAAGTQRELSNAKTALVVVFCATIALPLVAGLAPAASAALADRCAESWRLHRARWRIALVVLASVLPWIISFTVLEGFPNSGDEYAYLFQGRLFAHGRLWAPAPPMGYTFVPYRTWIAGAKWISQYPPGWPLALAGALFAGAPALMLNGALGSATVAALTSSRWQIRSTGLQVAAALAYMLTPFYLLNSASYHSHVFTALLILLLSLSCLSYDQMRHPRSLLAVGALLGLIGLTRYFSLLLVLPAITWWFFAEIRTSTPVRHAALIAISGMPFLVLLVWYQALVTGNPLHATYAVISGEEARLSIVLGDIIAGARFTLYRAAELATWISPILGGAYACCLFAKVRSRTIRFYDLLFPSFFLGFVFFPELGGNRYGPRYYFETFPLMVVTIASGVGPLVREWRPSRLRSLAFNGAAACVTYLLTALTAGLSAYHRQVESRHEPFRLVESRSLSDAIVIVRRGVNDGMISLDYPRNDPSLSAPVLYARPATTPEELHALFPLRSIWIYERKDSQLAGTLTRVWPAVERSGDARP